MPLTKLTQSVDRVQTLSDRPNALDGLDAAQLKAKFDEAGNIIKDYLNNVLIPELDAGNTAIIADYVSKLELTDIRKLSPTGNFTGSWHGIANPTYADPGIANVVNQHTERLSVIGPTIADVNYFVNATTGNDANDGLTISTALKSIQAAINRIPQIVNHKIDIILTTGDYSTLSTCLIAGFIGKGSINILGGEAVNDNYLTANVVITDCNLQVLVRGIRAVGAEYNFQVSNSRDIFIVHCKADNSSTTHDGIYAADSSSVTVVNCEINNKRSGIFATSKSVVLSSSNSGANNVYGLMCSDAAKIGKAGTQPIGITTENNFNGGQII